MLYIYLVKVKFERVGPTRWKITKLVKRKRRVKEKFGHKNMVFKLLFVCLNGKKEIKLE